MNNIKKLFNFEKIENTKNNTRNHHVILIKGSNMEDQIKEGISFFELKSHFFISIPYFKENIQENLYLLILSFKKPKRLNLNFFARIKSNPIKYLSLNDTFNLMELVDCPKRPRYLIKYFNQISKEYSIEVLSMTNGLLEKNFDVYKEDFAKMNIQMMEKSRSWEEYSLWYEQYKPEDLSKNAARIKRNYEAVNEYKGSLNEKDVWPPEYFLDNKNTTRRSN
jgi:hypothetical protein